MTKPFAPVPVYTDMGLEMRDVCERCRTPIAAAGEAWICSYECTFCAGCNDALDSRCPNCGGELVRRPRRTGGRPRRETPRAGP